MKLSKTYGSSYVSILGQGREFSESLSVIPFRLCVCCCTNYGCVSSSYLLIPLFSFRTKRIRQPRPFRRHFTTCKERSLSSFSTCYQPLAVLTVRSVYGHLRFRVSVFPTTFTDSVFLYQLTGPPTFSLGSERVDMSMILTPLDRSL